MYLADKRGTGQSSLFTCQPATLFLTDRTSCFNQLSNSPTYLDRLATTTYTNTATDMIYLMNLTTALQNKDLYNMHRQQKRFIIGSSNGGFLSQRILSVMGPHSYPALLDGVILNSAPPADYFNITENFLSADATAHQILGFCQADPNCMSRFSTSGLVSASTPFLARDDFLRQGLRQTHKCLRRLGATFENVSWSFASQFEFPGSWELIPVVLLRLARCNDNDLRALRYFINQIPSQYSDSTSATGVSLVVEYSIDWSENWMGSGFANHINDNNLNNGGPFVDSAQTVCDRLDGADMSAFVSYKSFRWFCDGWRLALSIPGFIHAPDRFTNSVPDVTNVPMIYLIGEMDSAVPLPFVNALSTTYKEMNPTGFNLIAVPRTGHTVADNSPIVSGGTSCGYTMIFTAVLSPSFTPDTSCIAQIVPFDFVGNSTLVWSAAKTFFNISSTAPFAMWDL
jgi:hypothetical protein